MNPSSIPFSTEIFDHGNDGNDEQCDVHDELHVSIIMVGLVSLISKGVPHKKSSYNQVNNIDCEVEFFGPKPEAAK